jgi:hypothetical protein
MMEAASTCSAQCNNPEDSHFHKSLFIVIGGHAIKLTVGVHCSGVAHVINSCKKGIPTMRRVATDMRYHQ